MAKTQVVEPGDCIASIAWDNGLFQDTVWNDAANSDLKSRRDPWVLNPGDVVVVRDKQEKIVDAATNVRHRFRVKGIPFRLNLTLTRDGKPRAGLKYSITAGKRTFEGKTGADGVIRHWIDPGVKTGRLTVGSKGESYSLNFNQALPIDEADGIPNRLINLGFLMSKSDRPEDLDTAVKRFRERYGLDPAGGIDGAFRAKLKEIHIK